MTKKIGLDAPVICLSSQNWFDDLWTNKQHLMKRLADRGVDVLYVVKGRKKLFEYMKSVYASDGEFKGDGIRKIDSHLYLAESPELPLFGLFKSSLRFERYKYKINRLIKVIERFHNQGVTPIVWVYHPGYGHYLDLLPQPFTLVYDCVDDYVTFPEASCDAREQEWIKSGEDQILMRADLVTVTAPALYDAKKESNPNVHLVHNVGDFDHFYMVEKDVFRQVNVFSKIKKPRIGFFGALSSYKVDFDLICHIAEARPDISICLMGPVTGRDALEIKTRLATYSNIHLFGSVQYELLPQYIQSMDVLMIPYLLNDHTNHVFPIKFFETFATGKPVVITALEAVSKYYKYALVGQTYDAFVDHINTALTKDTIANKSERISLARKHDWNSRLDAIVKLIQKLPQKK